MPALQFACPACKTIMQVRDDLQGKAVRCPKCQTILTVPAAAPEPITPAAPPPPAAPPAAPPPLRNGWYLARGEEKDGPYSPAQLKEMVTEGRLRADDKLLRDGKGKWVTASSVKGLFPAKVKAAAPPAPKPQPATPPAAPENVLIFDDDRPAGVSRYRPRRSSMGPMLVGIAALALVLLLGGGATALFVLPRWFGAAPSAPKPDATPGAPTAPGDAGPDRPTDTSVTPPSARPS